VKVSWFENAFETDPTQFDLDDVLQGIRGGEVKYFVEEARAALAQPGKRGDTKYKKLKESLPGFTASGTFSKRESDLLLEHSGFMLADLDKLGAERIPALQEKFRADPHVAFMFLSPSGRGLKIGMRIPKTGDPKVDGGNHKHAYFQVEHYFREHYSLPIDPQCKDVSRLCFTSFDPGLYVNAQAKQIPFVPLERLEHGRCTELQSVGSIEGFESLIKTFEDAATLGLSHKAGQNHLGLLKVRRGMFDLEIVWKRKLTPDEQKEVFDLWYAKAHRKGILRCGKPKHDYWVEFLAAIPKYPHSVNPLREAWKLALKKPFPPEAIKLFEGDLLTLQIAGLCRELQINAGASTIFASPRKVAGLVGADVDHRKVGNRFKALTSVKLLKLVTPGTQGPNGYTARYHYLGQLETEPKKKGGKRGKKAEREKKGAGPPTESPM
jgi:hypothetical protein